MSINSQEFAQFAGGDERFTESYQRLLVEDALLGLTLDGTLVLRRDPAWDAARQAWHLNVDQQPIAVVIAGSEADIVKVVDAARMLGIRVAPQATGHNASPLGSLAGSILLRTSELRNVTVDPDTSIARAAAGACWQDVAEAGADYGLTGLAGTARDVGVVGYLLGGGLSWFARSHGLAVNHIVAVEVVTADGVVRRVDALHEPELFWALRGGGGSFGIVTALEFRLFPIPLVYAGALFWPADCARTVLRAWREWTTTVPEEITSIGRLLTLPRSPEVPGQLAGRSFVMVEAVSQLSPDQTDELLAPLRALHPELDSFARTDVQDLWALHLDPDHPVPGTGQGALLDELRPSMVDAIIEASGPELVTVELRHVGGAASRPWPDPGAVSAFEAQYVLLAAGSAIDEQAAAATRDAVDVLLEAVTSGLAEVAYQNFCEDFVPGDVLFGAELHTRLQRVKDDYDPGNLIHANHTVLPSDDAYTSPLQV